MRVSKWYVIPGAAVTLVLGYLLGWWLPVLMAAGLIVWLTWFFDTQVASLSVGGGRDIDEDGPDGLQFPLQFLDLCSEQRFTIDNRRQLVTTLEDHDSTCPWDAQELLVFDALDRPVCLIISNMDGIIKLELTGETASEEDRERMRDWPETDSPFAGGEAPRGARIVSGLFLSALVCGLAALGYYTMWWIPLAIVVGPPALVSGTLLAVRAHRKLLGSQS